MPKQYLDDSGNPTASPAKVYLDDSGNPIAPLAPKNEPHPSDVWSGAHQPEERSALSKFLVPNDEQERGYMEMAKGAVKGAAATAQGLGKMIAPKGSFWDTGDAINTKSSNGYQTAGKVAEGIGEFVVPFPAAEAATQLPAAITKVLEKLPTATRGAKRLNEVEEAAGELPVFLTRASEHLMRASDLSDAGATLPGPIKKLLKSYTRGDEIDYSRARDIYSNLSHLSAKDNMALTPPMRRQIALIVHALKDDIGDTAAQVDKASTYYAGMKDYARAMKAARIKNAIVGALKSKAVKTAVGAGAGYAAAKAIEKEIQ